MATSAKVGKFDHGGSFVSVRIHKRNKLSKLLAVASHCLL
jgi:hypothetical protein